MNVKNVEKVNGIAKITVEIGKEEFEVALTKAYQKAKKQIAIPGFRKGKAPRKIVEAMYGPHIFYEDAVEVIFPDVYTAAIVDQKLNAVGQPSIADMDTPEEGGVVLTVVTDLYPEVTLGQYKGLEVTRAEATVDESEVEAELGRMAEQGARISTAERPAQLGDTVVLDFEGFVDGKAFEGGKGENFDLKLGSGQFIPGFEEQLVGITAGESREVNVTFPEQYDKALAGKDATFQCTVHEVKESILPELDDEFAKDVSEFDTLEELKADLREKQRKEKEDGIQSAFENACIEKAVEGMTVTVPNSMIEQQIDKQMEDFSYQMERSGMSMEDYARMMGGDMSKLRNTFRPMAESRVKADLLLAKIAEEEKLEVSDEEVEEELKSVADQYRMEVEKVKEYLSPESVRIELQSRKAVKLLADSAVAVAPKAEEPAEEATTEE